MSNVFKLAEGKVLPPGFQWLNEPSQWEFQKGQLLIHAEGKTDYFRDPKGPPFQDSGHFMFQEQRGDFTVWTYVQAEMRSAFDAGCLMVMLDEENWGKLCYEFSYQKPMIVSVVTQGLSDDCNSLEVPEEGVFLRITRFEDCFAFHYSLDGKWWELVRYFRLEGRAALKVGVVAQSPTGDGCQVRFVNLDVSSLPVRDIRSGK